MPHLHSQRTFLRIGIFFWNWDWGIQGQPTWLASMYMSFNNMALFLARTYYNISFKKSFKYILEIQTNFQQRQHQTSNLQLQDKVVHLAERITSYVFLFVVFTLFGLPLLIISVVHGYWSVISYLTMGFVLSSALIILLVNIIAKFKRSLLVLKSYWMRAKDENLDQELR